MLLGFFLFSCGGNTQDQQETESYEYSAEEDTQYTGAEETPAQKRYAERRAKGDTLAMHYKELQKFLPNEIRGFSREGEIEGSSMNMEDGSYSMASQRYRKGEEDLTITLIDYNNAIDMYEGLSGAWASGMSYEDDNQKANGVSLLNNKAKGMEVFAKKDNRCELMAGIAARFYLQIKVNNTTNASLCREIAEGLNLSALDAY
ncbi:hypothetical protein ADICEAN_02690 [Cesiribacter andamanensis AMV16]|uniref:Uncharacterized protein n=2 Tax=Cesiribacter TaxID=1133570 RepID=M7N4M0_9BACT|nr:hypothetical protein ADICEAN_02690 [Cesiribacter andamanensis AMV16]